MKTTDQGFNLLSGAHNIIHQVRNVDALLGTIATSDCHGMIREDW